MDLENFPTREMAKDMMSMISPIYDESYVAKWIFEVMSVSLALAKKTVEELADEAFPETATWSLPMWEQEYGLKTNEALSTEERRKRLTQKRNYRRPMNPWRIEQLVSEISGRKASLIENVEPHTYEIRIGDGENEVDVGAVYEAVYKVKQSQKHVRFVYEANVILGIKPATEPWQKRFTAAGTVPMTSRGLFIADGEIAVKTAAEGTRTAFPLAGASGEAGTYPATSRGLQIAADGIALETAAEGAKTVSPVSGDSGEAGTYPIQSTGLESTEGSVLPEISTESWPVSYTVCGDAFDI